MNQLGVSIIICCHNGAARLPETICHIAKQVVNSSIPWEFVFVDNGSTDGSALIVQDEWSKHNLPSNLNIVYEPALGLSHARAAGFRNAMYEYIILCDDDNWLNESYVETAYRIMTENPNVAALGGFGKLLFEVEPPKYIEYSHIFASGEQSHKSGKVIRNKVYGAGCVIRTSAYVRLLQSGFKSLLSDRKGTELSSGGDYELCYALAIIGYDIWYDERLQFIHYITKERLTWKYFIRYARESSRCFDVLTCYKFIATQSKVYNVALLVIAKEFLYCVKVFARINAQRMIYHADPVKGKLLLFKHIIFTYKLNTFFNAFGNMLKSHQAVLELKQNHHYRQRGVQLREQGFYATLKAFGNRIMHVKI